MKHFIALLLTIGILTNTIQAQSPKQVPGTEGQKTHEEAQPGTALPDFMLVTSSGKNVTLKDLPAGRPVIFTLFNPNCDHCQTAFHKIIDPPEAFKDAILIFLTFPENFSELESFVQHNQASARDNVYVGVAPSKFITGFFMPNYILPQVMVFNKQKKLKKIFYESVAADSLHYYINR